MNKTINLTNLNNKSIIRFFSKDNSIDFSHGSTHVLIYFDGSSNQSIDIFAELYIHQNNQARMGVFDLSIPKNVSTAKINISSDIHNVELVNVTEL